MARNFLPIPFAPYAGLYSSKPFDTARGQPKGLMVQLDILWAAYLANGQALGNANPQFNVVANLNAAGPNSVSQSWTIQSVYIDNEDVDFPVYVYFTDTQFAVSCPANSAGWYQVFTAARQAFVVGIGISDSSIAAGQRTKVFFTDVAMVPSLDQEVQSALALWLGSSTIQRENALLSGVGTPALGDQLFGLSTSFNNAVIPIPVLGGNPGQTLYITQYQLSTAGLLGAPFQGNVILSNDIDGAVNSFGVNIQANQNCFGILRDIRGNLRFNGAAHWTIQATDTAGSVTGAINVQFVFSIASQ